MNLEIDTAHILAHIIFERMRLTKESALIVLHKSSLILAAKQFWSAERELRLVTSEGVIVTKKLYGLAAALVVAAGLFGVKMLIAPPVTLAATDESLDINQLALSTPKNLPSFGDKYQSHLGVLDVLKAP